MTNKAKRFSGAFLRDCAPSGVFLVEGLNSAPICSVNYGGAGIALILYKLSRDRRDPGLLALAHLWIAHTVRSMSDPSAFYNPDLVGWNLTEELLTKTSLHHRESGVRWTEAFIARAIG